MKFQVKKITLNDINGIIRRIYAPLLVSVLAVLFLISLWLGYQYVFKILRVEPSSDMTVEKIDAATLKEVLVKQNERKKKLNQVWGDSYPDPFN